ncbi:MAG: tRNA uridine-5-carboxymethylaminomethyl(34) synthesis GTPase MnmE [Flavobacteriales bacterium]|nr:tRNA uridine-5-carboxymethylaminomethyl(34) synthesis GTPase MnmE [Flavobacteriales bacterium]
MQSLLDTIAAPATPPGVSALAVIRISGADAVNVVNTCFSKDLSDAGGYTMHYGHVRDGEQVVDEVIVSVFRSPHSYTGEDSVEISGHGSPYITGRILHTLLKNGCRTAEPGEFTLRAFLNKKLDLTQAEAVADMIHSQSEAGLQMALHQMRGGFRDDIAGLRQELIDFAALIELENDFGEEDVEFANRDRLRSLVDLLLTRIEKLRESFVAGNAMKHGIRTVIVGKPNAGKSTLLNALLKEERAIVSDIAGTTRDTIEELFTLDGVLFRLIDTAGLRESSDAIEQIGVDRAKASMRDADLIIYLFDAETTNSAQLVHEVSQLPEVAYQLVVANKTDLTPDATFGEEVIPIQAKSGNIMSLLTALKKIAGSYEFGSETIVNNARHADALRQSSDSLQRVLHGLDSGLSSDLVALDIRQSLHFLGLITGEVTTDDLLDSIFTRFCIGK